MICVVLDTGCHGNCLCLVVWLAFSDPPHYVCVAADLPTEAPTATTAANAKPTVIQGWFQGYTTAYFI